MSLLTTGHIRAFSLSCAIAVQVAMMAPQYVTGQERENEASQSSGQDSQSVQQPDGIGDLMLKSNDESKSLEEQLSLKQSAEQLARSEEDRYATFASQMMQLGSLCQMRRFHEAEELLEALRKSPFASTDRVQIQFAFFDATLKMKQGPGRRSDPRFEISDRQQPRSSYDFR